MPSESTTRQLKPTSLPPGARRGVRRYWGCIFAALILVASWPGTAFGQEQGSVINREYSIKAAFLYHFSTYIEWPESARPREGEPFVIGVYRHNPFGAALDQIAQQKKLAGHAIEIRLIKSIEEIAGCQILFVPASVTVAEQAALLKVTRSAPVFVVGESDDFVARGGDAQFFLEGNKVRFAFGEGAAERSDLKVSSKLLTLAKLIPNRPK
jgi:YfiR/HmsC-like